MSSSEAVEVDEEELRDLIVLMMNKLGAHGDPSTFVSYLAQNVSDYKMTKPYMQSIRRRLKDRSSDPDKFNELFESLKSRDTPEQFERMINLINKILEDPQLLAILHGQLVPSPQAERSITLGEQPLLSTIRPTTMTASTFQEQQPKATTTRTTVSLTSSFGTTTGVQKPLQPIFSQSLPDGSSTIDISRTTSTKLYTMPSSTKALEDPFGDAVTSSLLSNKTSNRALARSTTSSSTSSTPSTASSMALPTQHDNDPSSMIGDAPTTPPRPVGSSSTTYSGISPQFKQQLEAVTGKDYIAPFEKKHKKKVSAPSLPSWTRERAFLTGDFLKPTIKDKTPARREFNTKLASTMKLTDLPVTVQELVIIEELLSALMGFEGRFIRCDSDAINFRLDSSLDPSLADLVNRILPLCVQYVRVSHYVDTYSRYEYGLVNHALCAAIRNLLKEYLVLVAQLEHQFRTENLTLQKFWFYIQSAMKTMDILDRITIEARNSQCSGGALLNLIHRRASIMGGDNQTKDLFQYLMEKACAPYFEMLELWVYQGKVHDTYGEFLIEEKEHLKKDDIIEEFTDNYWDQKYTIRTEQFPSFLDKVSDKILTTGKYLNVIRECGRDIQNPCAEKIFYTSHEREYVEKIEKAYQFASRQLLNLIMGEYKLIDRLKSVKHYFLLDQGDFFVHFMDIAEGELRLPAQQVTLTKLESLLELSLRTSVAVSDPYKDDLTCQLASSGLSTFLKEVNDTANKTKQEIFDSTSNKMAAAAANKQTETSLTGLETFTLKYRVQWPVSLIMTAKALTKYQILFRHLFFCKNVERQICSTWLKHQFFTKDLVKLGNSALFTILYSLRQRMLYFLQNYEFYMMVEVIEPSWHLMEQNLRAANTIDDVMKYHNDFLDTCLKACMLSNNRLFQILSKLLQTCYVFAKNIEQFIDKTNEDADSSSAMQREEEAAAVGGADILLQKKRKNSRVEVYTAHARTVALDKNYIATIQQFEHNFNKYLRELLDALQMLSQASSSDYLKRFQDRMYYNQFYRQQDSSSGSFSRAGGATSGFRVGSGGIGGIGASSSSSSADYTSNNNNNNNAPPPLFAASTTRTPWK